MKGCIFFNKACCIYCRQVFEVRFRNKRWHNCKEAQKVRRALDRQMQKNWLAMHPEIDYCRDKRIKEIEPEKKYSCKRCGKMTYNRFKCPDCWSASTQPTNLLGYPMAGI